jgi:hypothetical protein
VANVTGKGGVVRLSRGTWAELQALRTDETFGEDCVFPMSAVNAWKRVKRAARLAGISEVPVSPTSYSRPETSTPWFARRSPASGANAGSRRGRKTALLVDELRAARLRFRSPSHLI